MVTRADYFARARQDLVQLIEQRKNAKDKDEDSLQRFFEAFPFTLNSALGGIQEEYNVFGNLIISQPRLKNFHGDRYPDFLVVTQNSLNFYFNFIEIEDPAKLIFDKREAKPSSDFNQAINQLHQWESMINQEVQRYCRELLDTLFDNNFNNVKEKVHHFNYILVYGFSDEVKQYGASYNSLLQNHFKNNHHHCTYSRLVDNLRIGHSLFTVRQDAASHNKFKALYCMPFKKYGMEQWSDWHNIAGKKEVIQNSSLFSSEEKSRIQKEMEDMDTKTKQEVHKMLYDDLGVNLAAPRALEDFDLW